MPFITGPMIYKEVLIPEHVEKQFDEDAYWHLDYWGNRDDTDGTWLYAKVAFPTIADAQHQQKLEKDAREMERQEGRRRTQEHNRERRAATRARQEAARKPT